MRRLTVLAGGVLAGVLAAAEPAAADEPNWQGDLFITAVSPGCAAGPIVVGDFYRGVFRPLQSGVTVEALSFVSERSAFLLQAPAGDTLGRVKATSTDIGGRASFDRVGGGAPVALTILPATITTTTPAVEIKGTVGHFFNISSSGPSCTVSISGVLGLRP
jgi:hypothetical protein